MVAEIQNPVSSELAEETVGKGLKHSDNRKIILEILEEREDNKEFIKKIREYAAEEMDRRVFRSAKYWTTVILTAIITSVIGLLVGMLL